MDCERALALLPAYLDGELDLVTALELEAHLGTCDACAREYAAQRDLQGLLAGQRAELVAAPPPALEQRLRARLRQSAGLRPAPQPFFRPWGAAAAVLLVVALFALGVFLLSRGAYPGQESVVAQEVEVAHVRSLLPGHLTDVVSSDQHTVKPWFDGKLDFSPPVLDLSAQGFPLAGGRLEYIDGHPAAALVYLRNKHVINLLVWPSTASPGPLQLSSVNGYHLFQWRQGAMEFWAASDLETAELRAFVELIQQGAK